MKSGVPHIVPLSQQAVEVLQESFPLTEQGRDERKRKEKKRGADQEKGGGPS